MEELTALPRDPSLIWGCRFAAGRGMGGQEREGKGRRRGRAGQGRGVEGPLRLRIPVAFFTQVRRLPLPIIVN